VREVRGDLEVTILHDVFRKLDEATSLLKCERVSCGLLASLLLAESRIARVEQEVSKRYVNSS
jgi:hypothetical protein